MSITYRFFGVAIQNSKGPALSVHQNLFKLPAPLEQAGLTGVIQKKIHLYRDSMIFHV